MRYIYQGVKGVSCTYVRIAYSLIDMSSFEFLWTFTQSLNYFL